MALSPTAIREVDAVIKKISLKIWNLSTSFPMTGLHALPDDLGLNVPSVCEDYCGAPIRACTHILNDEGGLGTTARASLLWAANMFYHWPL